MPTGRRTFTLTSLAVFLFAAIPSHAAPPQLGKVNFPSSCSGAAQPILEKGLALLHSFQYLQAQNTFAEASKADPKCALAHWGKAMSLYHQLWDFPGADILKKGREELTIAKKLKPKNPREKEFIETASVFFQDKPKLTKKDRIAAYSAALEHWNQQLPGDVEVGSFYALSLVALSTADDDEDPAKTLPIRQKAIAILDPLLEKYPDNPGVAHYLIHAADRQPLAAQGLEAAKRYAGIAPDSSHALHMPSHIFVRLGMWQDSIASNIAAQSAGAHAAEMHQAESHYQTHAMDFLNHSYVQSGQQAKALDVIAQQHHVVGATESSMGEHISELSARTYIDLHDWKSAAALPDASDKDGESIVFWARSIAKSRSGDLNGAREELKKLDKATNGGEKQARGGSNKPPTQNSTELQEAQAWIDFANGDSESAIKSLRALAERDEKLDAESFATPPREMLADMLLELKRPGDALVEYKAELIRYPGRFNPLYGVSISAQAAGDSATAREYSAKLLEMCGPNGDRVELQKVKALLVPAGSSQPSR